jgi:ATP-dependent exoDNAse (exonuclease V) beta subunit
LDTNFKIINASAGSGKTFTLVLNILKEFFLNGEDFYKKILALTFTNNAANEMKKRILDELVLISESPSSSKIFSLIKNDVKLSDNAASLKAKRISNKILHNFSFFQVGTIDKFNHRIIRAFSQELSLSGDFDLIIDQDEYTEKLIDEFLDNLDEKSFLTDVLSSFSIQKIENNNSWDISYDLSKLMNLIMSESNFEFISKAEELDKKSYLRFKKHLDTKIYNLKKKYIPLATELLNLCKAVSPDYSDFPRQALPKFLMDIVKGEIERKKIEGIIKRVDSNTILRKGAIEENIEFLENSVSMVLKITDYLNKLMVYESIKINNTQNHIIQEIKNFSLSYQIKNNILLISEFNNIISENIADQPAPYIYEKLGNRFNNYFIDEFQDTSELQWKNIIPLTSHAIEGVDINDSPGSLLLVGDPKQSLYQWRGASPEIFKSIIEKETPFFIQPTIHTLEKNFRSSKFVVEFNNSFFSFIMDKIKIDQVHQTFNSFQQKHTKVNTGQVSVSFIDKSTKDEYRSSTLQSILNIILKKLDQNFSLKDIAILLRSNDECAQVSNFLLENKIYVKSEDMLSIDSCPEIIFLISVLKVKNDLNNVILKLEILKFLSIQNKEIKKHDFIDSNLVNNISLIFKKYLNLDFQKFQKLDIYDSVEFLINNTCIFNEKIIYVQSFLDLILEYRAANKKFKETFFEYWDRKKSKIKITPPSDMNAVKVLTVHKSKGLQYPIVILPFFDSNLIKTNFKTWIELKENDIHKKVLLQFSKSLKDFNDNTLRKYNNLISNMTNESINLMYVALTRAQNENHIISKLPKEKNLNSFSGLIHDFLVSRYSKNFQNNQLLIGKETRESHLDESIINKYDLKLFDRKENLDLDNYIFTNKSENLFKGEVFHKIMEEIVYNYQFEKVFDDFRSSGIITEKEFFPTKKLVEQILNKSEIKDFFDRKNTVFNEREIYLSENEVIRPDKIIFHNNRSVSILDYKTGLKKIEDMLQIKKYISSLEKGGFKVKKAILIYTKEKLEITQIV